MDQSAIILDTLTAWKIWYFSPQSEGYKNITNKSTISIKFPKQSYYIWKFVCHFNLIYPYILYFVNLLFGDLIKGTRPKLLLICLKNYHSLQFFNWWLQRCDFLVALKSHWLYGDHTPSWTVFICCMRWDMYFAL